MRVSAGTRAVLSVIDFSTFAYTCEISPYGDNLDRNMIYTATLMRPPMDPQLCEFPAFDSTVASNLTIPIELQAPLALLVSLGGCDVYTKTEIALQINKRISRSVRYIVFYNNDPDDNDGIVQILPPPQETGITVPEDIQKLAFLSVSTSAGVSLMGLIQKHSNAAGKNAEFLREGSENWDLGMVVEKLLSEPSNPPPSQNYSSSSTRINGGNFYWFRFILFALLIISPCCRGAYLWWNGGGRIYFRRNENGRIVGVQYVSPMAYWFASNVGQESSPSVTHCLTEEEVLALPEIVYKRPDESEPEGNDENGTINDDVPNMGDLDIIICSGSDDANERCKEAALERAPSVSESIRSDEEHTVDDNYVTSCTTCSICIDEFEVGERLRLLPRCKHAFHTDCIMPWLTERQGCCPLCKAKVIEREDSQDNIRDLTTEAEATIVSQDDDGTEHASQEEQLSPAASVNLGTVVSLTTEGNDSEQGDGNTTIGARAQA